MSLVTTEELDAVHNHIGNIPPIGAMYAPVLIGHARALLAEVERLRADPLPAAAWVREVQQAAYQRGAEAMREAAALALYDCHTTGLLTPANVTASVRVVRALPLPQEGT